jgi:lysozyme family protein
MADQSARSGGVVTRAAIPRATYRLQFHKGFGFDQAAELAHYLARLGVSHIYASPRGQAVRTGTISSTTMRSIQSSAMQLHSRE